MNATFKVPSVSASSSNEIEWEMIEMASLPPQLAKQVKAIHEADEQIKAVKAAFVEQFNDMYSELVPAGMVRRFSYKFDGLSIGNAVIKTKSGKGKVQFTVKKGK